jgi:hypothetical protein
MGHTVVAETKPSINLPLVSTRNQFNVTNGELLQGHNSTDYNATNIPGLQSEACPVELIIFVHGPWVDGKFRAILHENASEIFDRAKMSLAQNNYTYPLVGFTWDSNTIISPVGWTIAKFIAKENGPKLAQFMFDFMKKCANNNSKVRLIAHSVGARVVLSALESLGNNQQWNNRNFKISSVHLLGAAVDDEEVSKDFSYVIKNPRILGNTSEWYDVFGIKSAYGKAIEHEVNKFYNLFDPKDRILIQIYPLFESDAPLGLKGAEKRISLPSNYNQKDVENVIPPLCDANGDNRPDLLFQTGEQVNRGENSAGYEGFRNPINYTKLIDDGAINTVVRDWNITSVHEKQNSTLSGVCNGTAPRLQRSPLFGGM